MAFSDNLKRRKQLIKPPEMKTRTPEQLDILRGRRADTERAKLLRPRGPSSREKLDWIESNIMQPGRKAPFPSGQRRLAPELIASKMGGTGVSTYQDELAKIAPDQAIKTAQAGVAAPLAGQQVRGGAADVTRAEFAAKRDPIIAGQEDVAAEQARLAEEQRRDLVGQAGERATSLHAPALQTAETLAGGVMTEQEHAGVGILQPQIQQLMENKAVAEAKQDYDAAGLIGQQITDLNQRALGFTGQAPEAVPAGGAPELTPSMQAGQRAFEHGTAQQDAGVAEQQSGLDVLLQPESIFNKLPEMKSWHDDTYSTITQINQSIGSALSANISPEARNLIAVKISQQPGYQKLINLQDEGTYWRGDETPPFHRLTSGPIVKENARLAKQIVELVQQNLSGQAPNAPQQGAPSL